ncbi:PepSY domain-containing protein [uncultured Roseibium sp.]|uniref:PepSY domain-containing protein n=1 Tax=uncultured Roseibium sp. TaxID=1936171 RepID=UPI0032162BD2
MKAKITFLAAGLAFYAGTLVAGVSEGKVDAKTEAAIMAKLAAMECQMAPEDIEVTAEGYDLDDVICKGGKQFDIELDKDLNETGRRAE